MASPAPNSLVQYPRRMNMGDFCHDRHYFHRNCWFHARCPNGQPAYEAYLTEYKEGLLLVLAARFPTMNPEVQFRRLESMGRLGHLGIYPKGGAIVMGPQLNPLAVAFVPAPPSSPSSSAPASQASSVAPDTPPTPSATLSPLTLPAKPLDARVMRYTEDWCDDEYIQGVFD